MPAPRGFAQTRPVGLGGEGGLVARLVAFALIVRIVSALLAFLANVVFPLHTPEPFTVFGRPHLFWDTFARWDSGWYVGIARDGYAFVEGGRSNLAFFPAYPVALRWAGWLLGGRTEHFFLGGVLVSWVAFTLAVVLLWQLARLDLDEDGATRAVIYAAVFPFAIFHGLVYSESLFLLLMVATMLAVRQRRWVTAGLVGALAMVSRVNALMALPALAWMAWRAARGDRQHVVSAAIALLTMLTGFAAWCGYVYLLSGNPFEWAASIRRWDYHPGQMPWLALSGLLRALWSRPYQFLTTEPLAPYDTVNGLTALAFLVAAPLVWWRLGAAYGLFVLANLLLPLSSGQLVGLGRYCAVLFPVFIWLGAVGRWPLAHATVLFVFSAGYTLVLAMFVNIHPIF